LRENLRKPQFHERLCRNEVKHHGEFLFVPAQREWKANDIIISNGEGINLGKTKVHENPFHIDGSKILTLICVVVTKYCIVSVNEANCRQKDDGA
jgi:hypothetical protein